ncbi:hypothetical protein KIN20_019469 [Parelaphostrongylus tenuis]|uniref:Uncharacterized protein n=1 Tax=Parelaphostrongylus tenuis TaxID=148309 RepID=A0AAD5MRL8_PARTN|nr:hypothetical protein KIN20_019469 [Parelaphostrongylus tenuis]
MAKLLGDPFMIPMLATISTILGCGVLPSGEARSTTFNVTGLTTLPVAMVHSSAPDVQAQIPGISFSEGSAQAFVQRLVMQTVIDVLERRGRSALVPESVISVILSQLEVRITYTPLQCQKFTRTPTMDNEMDTINRCIIIDSTVTGICAKTMQTEKCMDADKSMITPVPADHTSISGTLMTTNIIMANWSRMMWQNVLDRALRMLASAPLGSHFLSARALVGGN